MPKRPEAGGRPCVAELTAAGRRVLDGDEDHVALNGIDRWIGGVHLVGREVPWRWDDGVEAVGAAAGA
jgi:hypothetical protein